MDLRQYSAFQDDEDAGNGFDDLDADLDFGEEEEEMANRSPGKGETLQAHAPSADAGSRRSSQRDRRKSSFHVEVDEAAEDYGDDAQRFLVGDDDDEDMNADDMNEADVDAEETFLPPNFVFDDAEKDDPVETFRKELLKLQEDLHYEEWAVLTTKEKLSGIIEPTVLGTLDIPPNVMYYARLYSIFQSAFALILPYSLLMLTGVPATRSLGGMLFAISTVGASIDILLRIVTYLPKRSKLGIVMDIFVAISSLIALAEPDKLGGLFVYFSMFRAIHVFRFITLFKDYETFRDLFLVQQTITSSFSVLCIVLLFAFIAVFIGSTFMWAFESSVFDTSTGVWMRHCTPDVPCEDNVAPYQSIPAAMWFAVGCVTLTGFGDTFPASALGRFVSGAVCVVGVFMLSFPTTILIGNLGIIRNTFLKEHAIRDARIMSEAIERITEQLEQGTHGVSEDLLEAELEGLQELEKKTNLLAGKDVFDTDSEQSENVDATEQMEAHVPEKNENDDINFQENIEEVLRHLPPTGQFYFMSSQPRKVVLMDTGVYLYLPIFQVVHAADGLPLLGNITKVDATTSTVTLFLCVDDVRAQRAAIQSVGAHRKTVARASPIVSMTISMTRSHPACTLFRREDVGEVHDNYIPLVFLVRSVHRFQTMERLRRAFLGTKLLINYTPAISSAAVWAETIFVTAELLSTTKFIEELKALSVMVAPTIFFNEEEQEEVDEEDLVLKKRKNISFIHPDHIYQLLDGIFEKIEVPDGASIRNREEILDSVLELILLHSRELYFKDIPPIIRSAVFEVDEVTVFDRVVEVDLEFFRKSEWPMGTVVVRYGYDAQELELEVVVSDDACQGDQPEIAFMSTLANEYTLEDDEMDKNEEEATPQPEGEEWAAVDERSGGPSTDGADARESPPPLSALNSAVHAPAAVTNPLTVQHHRQ